MSSERFSSRNVSDGRVSRRTFVKGLAVGSAVAGLGPWRWKEGDTVTLRVANALTEDASIHWHGIVLPANMDGVPGLSFHGIRPGETYVYRFRVRQAGTYWYHSHSGFQEQHTNRLVLQPLVEAESFGKSDPERGVGAGLSTTDAGFRLRYEFRRKVAPYVGITWKNNWGKTADFAEAVGEETGGARFVTGLRLWF